MLTRHAVFSQAVTINHLLTKEAVALHGVAVPTASSYGVFSEANHSDSRAQGFSFLNRAAEVCRFEVEHCPSLLLLGYSFCHLTEDSITHLCKSGKQKLTLLCNQCDRAIVQL